MPRGLVCSKALEPLFRSPPQGRTCFPRLGRRWLPRPRPTPSGRVSSTKPRKLDPKRPLQSAQKRGASCERASAGTQARAAGNPSVPNGPGTDDFNLRFPHRACEPPKMARRDCTSTPESVRQLRHATPKQQARHQIGIKSRAVLPTRQRDAESQSDAPSCPRDPRRHWEPSSREQASRAAKPPD